MTNINELFGRIDDNGNAHILYTEDGDKVTTIETDTHHVYPICSGLSTNYEHAEGIALSPADAKKLGIEIEG